MKSMEKRTLNVGFFNDFKGGDALLFNGNQNVLEDFARLLDSITQSKRLFLNTVSLCGVQANLEVELVLTDDITKVGIENHALEDSTKIIINLIPLKVDELQTLIGGMRYTKEPCHQYFDIDDNIKVVISSEEYNNLFVG
jgi:hypothetical protein